MLILESALIAIVLLTALSLLWSTLRTGISPMMSSGKASRAMLAAIDDSIDRCARGPLIDLGSGWGTLIIAVAKKYPQHQVIGYELSWLPWIFSMLWKYRLGLDNLTIYRKNFNHADLNHAGILFCYLFSDAMQALKEKLKRERLTEVIVVSNTFALPSCEPTTTIQLDDFHRANIYLYHWQPKNNEQ